MAKYLTQLPDLVIPNGGTTSNAVTIDEASSITIFAPSTLTGTVTVQVEPTAEGTAWVTLVSAAVDVAVAASRAVVINPCAFLRFRVISGSAEAAARTFQCMKQWENR